MLVENKEKTDLFLQYLPMIEQAVWKNVKRFKIEFEEVEGQAFLVFCEAIEKFDDTRNIKFGTYLYSRLRTVADKYAKPKSVVAYPIINPLQDCTADFIHAMETMETALCLSEDAQGVLNFLISREWETPGMAKTPRLHSVQKWLKQQFDWMPSRTKKAWEELKVWWQSEGQNTFSMGGSI